MEKDKYLIFDKSTIDNYVIYCENDDNKENIVKCLLNQYFVEKFNKNKYRHLNIEVKNDDSLFITKDIYGTLNIWQIMGKYSDTQGTIVPHLYKLKNIGIITY